METVLWKLGPFLNRLQWRCSIRRACKDALFSVVNYIMRQIDLRRSRSLQIRPGTIDGNRLTADYWVATATVNGTSIVDLWRCGRHDHSALAALRDTSRCWCETLHFAITRHVTYIRQREWSVVKVDYWRNVDSTNILPKCRVVVTLLL